MNVGDWVLYDGTRKKISRDLVEKTWLPQILFVHLRVRMVRAINNKN